MTTQKGTIVEIPVPKDAYNFRYNYSGQLSINIHYNCSRGLCSVGEPYEYTPLSHSIKGFDSERGMLQLEVQ